jgi:class 3 adenylate cyclase
VTNPYLEWIDENLEVRRLSIFDRVFIGRICKGIDETRRIIVKHPDVSRDHAEISLSGSQLQIRDRSKNGTWVNEVRITAGSTRYLADGDVIRLGETLIHVRYTLLTPLDKDDDWLVPPTKVTPKEAIVTNLVADVRGFSSMFETVESYRVYELMKEIFGRFSAIVSDHKGTIKDYAGDAIYAFWDHGSGLRIEQAVSACRSALKQVEIANQIRTELRSINPVAELLQMGWGITTGMVTMSHYGSRVSELALVGDSTNLAFRLSALANKNLPCEIVICSHTAELIRNTLSVDDLGVVFIRGRSDQEHVFGLSEKARRR